MCCCSTSLGDEGALTMRGSIDEHPLKCEQCCQILHSVGDLKVHQQLSCDHCSIRCTSCDVLFSGQLDHIRHWLLVSSRRAIAPATARKHRCDKCSKSFHSLQWLTRHHETHNTLGRFKCLRCSKSFGSLDILKSHEITHLDERLHICTQCGKKFKSLGSLNVHERIHAGERRYHCSWCFKPFPNALALAVHERVHTGERPYKCVHCNKSFAYKFAVQLHLRMHTGERPYKCGFCDRSFAQPVSLQVHERLHTGERPYKCNQCDKTYADRSSWRTHQLISHERESWCRCAQCGQYRVGTAALARHQAKHAKECSKQRGHDEDLSDATVDLNETSPPDENRSRVVKYDPSQPYLQSNKWLFHNATPAFCSLYYITLNHSQSRYAGLKYNCRYCLRLFTNSESVTEHILAMHVPVETQFGCGCCGNSFEFAPEAEMCLQRHEQSLEDFISVDLTEGNEEEQCNEELVSVDLTEKDYFVPRNLCIKSFYSIL